MGAINFKALYSEALALHPNELVFTAHSHGFRPDAYRVGQNRCTDDTFRLIDDKWVRIFGKVIPDAQGVVARFLGSDRPGHITFGTNTHELLMRVLSSYWGQPLRILTTDAEFYSAEYQHVRLADISGVTVMEVPLEPFMTFPDRFLEEASKGYEVVFFSHVFYNSGHVVRNLADLVTGLLHYVRKIIIDGYHAVGAFPVNTVLEAILDSVYYVSGCYKYLQAGEGAGYLSLPEMCEDRPVDVGWVWMAGTDLLERGIPRPILYGSGGYRYLGATPDVGALYRLNAIWEVFSKAGIDAATVQNHVVSLQDLFLAELDRRGVRGLNRSHLVHDLASPRANFLCFDYSNAAALCRALKERGVWTDNRRGRIRFGFALYHAEADVAALAEQVARVA